MAIFFLCSGALAQSAEGDSSGSIFETIARGLHKVGEKTQSLIPPRFSPLGELGLVDFSGKPSVSRDFEQNVPVQPGAQVSISHEFGEVRVEAWDDPVVQVRATIRAGAETLDLAQEIAKATTVNVATSNERVDIRTAYPDTRDLGEVAKEVNYSLIVPKSAQVTVRNSFGDTSIQDVAGRVAVDSQFGAVTLRDLGGSVTARTRGDFPLQASGLRQGGTFKLHGTQAAFSRVAGALLVNSFLGSVTIRDLAEEVEVDASVDSGPLRLFLKEDGAPDLQVSALFGAVKSDLPLHPIASGDLTYGSSPNLESRQRVRLDAAFGDIEISRESVSVAAAASPPAGSEYTEAAMERHMTLPEGAEVIIEAIRGNVRIEGADEDVLTAKATQLVQMMPKMNPRAAIEALDLRLEEMEGRIHLKAAVRDDMTALGCSYYRMDLTLTCPRTSPLRVHAPEGHTFISGMGEAVVVEQSKGTLTIEHTKGPLGLTNRWGDVTVLECAGPITVSAERGRVVSRAVHDKQVIRCNEGKTVIDGPRGEVVVRQRGGDVRIIPIDGILGSYDVRAEGGDVSIIVPEYADATLLASVRNGQVRTAIPLTGEIGKDYQKFQGRPNADASGQHQVVLETIDGDIVIDKGS